MSDRAELERLRKLKRLRELQARAGDGDDSMLDTVADFVRGPGQAMAQGATFGFYDEMRGLADKALGGDYQAGVEQAREEAETYRQENPVKSTALELVGGLMTGIPAGAVAGGSRMGQAAASRIPALLRYGGAGAGAGALAGAGYAEEDERLASAGKGAIAGGALGTGLPVAGRVAGSGMKFLGKLAGVAAPAKNRAYNKLAEALRRDSLTPERTQANLRKLGPEAMIADAGGENVRGLAEAAAQMPGRTRNQAVAAVNRRQAGQQNRVMDALTQTMGDEKDFYQTLKTIGQQKRANAAPLYREAFEQDIPFTETLQSLTKRPTVQKAMRRAVNQAADEGEDIAGAFKIKDGEIQGLEQPSMRVWDYVKRGLDEVIESNTDDFGKVNAEGRRAINLKNQLLGELDDQNPSYAQARKVFSDDAANENALKMGRKFIRQDADITEELVNNMSEAEADYFRAGAIRAIRDKIESASDTSDAYKRIFNNPSIRNKLQAVFPDKRSFAQFARQMKNESTFYQTRGQLTGNSATARRQAQQADLTENVDPEALSAATFSPGYAASRGALGIVSNRLGLPEDVVQELGPMLLSQEPATQQQVISRLLRMQNPSAVGNQLRQLNPGAGTVITGSAQGQRLAQ